MAAKLRVAFERAKRILIIIDHCNFHFRISFLVNREDIKKFVDLPKPISFIAGNGQLIALLWRSQVQGFKVPPLCLSPATGKNERGGATKGERHCSAQGQGTASTTRGSLPPLHSLLRALCLLRFA